MANAYVVEQPVCSECGMEIRMCECHSCHSDIDSDAVDLWCIEGKHYHKNCYTKEVQK